jgi:hypothetical protein
LNFIFRTDETRSGTVPYMKKILLVFCLLLPAFKIFGQQFSQYNTGTLYDSFENPSERVFIPDTSKKFATNYFAPNFNVNFFLKGDAQATLKSRLILNAYDNSLLMINQSKYNHVTADANVYVVMFKMFASLNGDEELGFSAQTRAEAKGLVPDDAIAALNGAGSFANGINYNDIFNGNYFYQTYHQFGLTYREKFNKQFSFGIKLSMLLGIQYQKLDVTSSSGAFDNITEKGDVALNGTYYASFVPGNVFKTSDFLPTFRNPGAAISIGTSFKTQDGFFLQANIKDLGFIHWSQRSETHYFDNSEQIIGLGSPHREDSTYNKISALVHNDAVEGSFTTPIDGKAELSVSKTYWLDDDYGFKYSPTLIFSKELFYTGFVAALVNPVQYKNYVVTLTGTYDELHTFSLGTQFMVKSPNFEIFMGSDKIAQTVSLLTLNKNSSQLSQNGSFTGMNFFFGFALKFGEVVEHPMNASVIPMGAKGFLARLYGRLFKTYN